MKHTHLIQRFEAPRPIREEGLAKLHHVFGGGMLGISDEGWKVLDPICTPEYMGAAEYEFGTLSNALKQIAAWARDRELVSFAFLLGAQERKLSWDRMHNRTKKALPMAKTVLLFGLCRASDVTAVEERIKRLALDTNEFYVKRGTRMVESLDPLDSYQESQRTLGWFELDNLFMFFSDQTMWSNFCDMFEVPKAEVPELPTKIDFKGLDKKKLVSLAVSLGVYRTQTQANKIGKNDLLKTLEDLNG